MWVQPEDRQRRDLHRPHSRAVLQIRRLIRAIVFDLDNTLVDFMSMKKLAVEAAIDAMIDAGLTLDREEAEREIFAIYDREGIEYQRVFDDLLETRMGQVITRSSPQGSWPTVVPARPRSFSIPT